MFYAIKVGSVTNAQRARDILKTINASPRIEKTSRPKKGEGCGYAVQLYTNDIEEAVRALKQNGIRVIEVETV